MYKLHEAMIIVLKEQQYNKIKIEQLAFEIEVRKLFSGVNIGNSKFINQLKSRARHKNYKHMFLIMDNYIYLR